MTCAFPQGRARCGGTDRRAALVRNRPSGRTYLRDEALVIEILILGHHLLDRESLLDRFAPSPGKAFTDVRRSPEPLNCLCDSFRRICVDEQSIDIVSDD